MAFIQCASMVKERKRITRDIHDTIGYAMMNIKMNRLIEEEVGEDNGQMLPSINGSSWTLSTSIDDFRP